MTKTCSKCKRDLDLSCYVKSARMPQGNAGEINQQADLVLQVQRQSENEKHHVLLAVPARDRVGRSPKQIVRALHGKAGK